MRKRLKKKLGRGDGGLMDRVFMHKRWTITKYADDAAYARGEAYEVATFEGNLLLNEGIAVLQTLLIGTGGTAFSNANARCAVGDSSTAAAATQTGLQASTNKVYQAQEAGFPSIAGNVTTWKSVFGSASANFAWNEFTVASGSSDAAVNLNRRVSAQGTKTAGQTWTLELAITWS
jgi:hypothetical protein